MSAGCVELAAGSGNDLLVNLLRLIVRLGAAGIWRKVIDLWYSFPRR